MHNKNASRWEAFLFAVKQPNYFPVRFRFPFS